MAIYRVKQFIWAVTARFKPIDYELVRKYLNKNEEKLFNMLSISERHHSIRVCNEALNRYEHINKDIDKDKLAKIALLHDVGKSNTTLNVIDKSILVILDKVTKGSLRKYDRNRKIDIYYNHANKSVRLLKDIDKYDLEFLEAIEKHHHKKINSNIYLKIIKESDDNS